MTVTARKRVLLLGVSCVLALGAAGRAAETVPLKVATYNIRLANVGDDRKGNGWERRGPVIAQLVRFHDFDAFGAQEVKHNQLLDLLKWCPEYGYVGGGRDDGKEKGEYSPIFYRKDRLTLLRAGQFWISETPDNPSKGWDAALPRICTWAEFRAGRRTFWFLNLHMDHKGIEARIKGSELVLAKIKELCGNAPAILTGDFNFDQNHEGYKRIVDSGMFADTFDKASIRYAMNGTFNSFLVNKKTEIRIDHIFASRHFEPIRYGVLTDLYWTPVPPHGGAAATPAAPTEPEDDEPAAPSAAPATPAPRFVARIPADHYPVVAQLNFR